MTSRLRKVEVIKPPMTTMPMGARKLGSTPQPSAMGIMPAAMAMVVMMMGRARLRQASSTLAVPRTLTRSNSAASVESGGGLAACMTQRTPRATSTRVSASFSSLGAAALLMKPMAPASSAASTVSRSMCISGLIWPSRRS
jgi:hypothetical protein